jgi:hypothetical protein
MKSIHSIDRPSVDAFRAALPDVRPTGGSNHDGWGMALAFSGGGTPGDSMIFET